MNSDDYYNQTLKMFDYNLNDYFRGSMNIVKRLNAYNSIKGVYEVKLEVIGLFETMLILRKRNSL